jgi:hypothetical protein
MTILNILILAVVQGAAELLPMSSSAHVIVAAKLMGLDPVRPEMTLLLVMLHTGTMFAVITYFWSAWRANYARSRETLGGKGPQVPRSGNPPERILAERKYTSQLNPGTNSLVGRTWHCAA